MHVELKSVLELSFREFSLRSLPIFLSNDILTFLSSIPFFAHCAEIRDELCRDMQSDPLDKSVQQPNFSNSSCPKQQINQRLEFVGNTCSQKNIFAIAFKFFQRTVIDKENWTDHGPQFPETKFTIYLILGNIIFKQLHYFFKLWIPKRAFSRKVIAKPQVPTV